MDYVKLNRRLTIALTISASLTLLLAIPKILLTQFSQPELTTTQLLLKEWTAILSGGLAAVILILESSAIKKAFRRQK